MVVATPESPEARKWVDESLSSHAPPQPQAPAPSAASAPTPASQTPSAIVSRDPPSIRVKNDVRRIAMQEIERRRKEQDRPLKGIIRVNNKDGKKITFSSTLQQEHPIVNENPNVPLRPVK